MPVIGKLSLANGQRSNEAEKKDENCFQCDRVCASTAQEAELGSTHNVEPNGQSS